MIAYLPQCSYLIFVTAGTIKPRVFSIVYENLLSRLDGSVNYQHNFPLLMAPSSVCLRTVVVNLKQKVFQKNKYLILRKLTNCIGPNIM